MAAQSKANDELERYLELTPRSQSLWEEARQYLPGGETRSSVFWAPYPIYIDHGEGCHVRDADGVERLDFIGNMTSLMLGKRLSARSPGDSGAGAPWDSVQLRQ